MSNINQFPQSRIYGSIIKPPSHIHEPFRRPRRYHDPTLVAVMLADREYIDECRAEAAHHD